MSNQTVRIIIPLFNMERFVADAIRSVLSQTYRDLELVIVDDGSSDKSVDVVKAFKDDRIILLQQENQGPESARQAGFVGCKTAYVARMDADDVMAVDRIERQVRFLEANPAIGLVGGQIMFLSEDGQKAAFRSTWPLDHETLCKGFQTRRFKVCDATIMCRRSIQERIPLSPYGGPGAGTGFLLECACITRVANLLQVIHYVRIHDSSIQSSFSSTKRLQRSGYAFACYKARQGGAEPPTFQDVVEGWKKRSVFRKVADFRLVLLGRASRKFQWHYLNGSPFPIRLPSLFLCSLLAPDKIIKRSILTMRGVLGGR